MGATFTVIPMVVGGIIQALGWLVAVKVFAALVRRVADIQPGASIRVRSLWFTLEVSRTKEPLADEGPATHEHNPLES